MTFSLRFTRVWLDKHPEWAVDWMMGWYVEKFNIASFHYLDYEVG